MPSKPANKPARKGRATKRGLSESVTEGPRSVKIVGIDPGKSGGMACINLVDHTVEVFKFSGATERDIINQLKSWAHGPNTYPIHVILERVGPQRTSDVKQGASSMFTFGQGYGFLRGALFALELPFEEVQPVKWQREFSLLRTNKNETSTQKKNRHKSRAEQLMPSIKVVHATADALLIMEYGRRLFLKGER